MASTSDFKNGLVLKHKTSLWKIIEFLHVKPGKGPAFVRTKLKNLLTGQIVEETFRSGAKIETVQLKTKSFNYLYSSGRDYFFMDNDSYEQITLDEDVIKEIKYFLTDNVKVDILFDEKIPIEIKIPKNMNLKVTQCEPGIKGNSSQTSTKPATLETGLIIQVPLFIKEGELIKVNTDENKYIERVKN